MIIHRSLKGLPIRSGFLSYALPACSGDLCGFAIRPQDLTGSRAFRRRCNVVLVVCCFSCTVGFFWIVENREKRSINIPELKVAERAQGLNPYVRRLHQLFRCVEDYVMISPQSPPRWKR